jgi:hypothetical protein
VVGNDRINLNKAVGWTSKTHFRWVYCCTRLPMYSYQNIARASIYHFTGAHVLRSFSGLLCVPIEVIIIPYSSARALWLQQRHIEVNQWETLREMSVNFAGEVFLSYSTGIFNRI